MKVVIRRIGNSRGVVIPKPLLVEAGLEAEAEMAVEEGALVLRKPAAPPRAGWAEAARALAERSDDAVVLRELDNAGDANSTW
jgi:antitoxin MazE